jgi:hypothetical protein
MDMAVFAVCLRPVRRELLAGDIGRLSIDNGSADNGLDRVGGAASRRDDGVPVSVFSVSDVAKMRRGPKIASGAMEYF